MPLDVSLEDGEELIFGEIFAPSKKMEPVALGVSDRAIFLSRKRAFAVRDPRYVERVPLSQVREVEVRDVRSPLLLALAGLLIVAGLVTSILVVLAIVRKTPGMRAGYPFGVLAVGLVLPFVARRRRRLYVRMVSSEFRWASPLTVDSAPRLAARAMQERFVAACQSVGVRIVNVAA